MAELNSRLKFPFGVPDRQTPADAATIAPTIFNTRTKVVMPATQAMALALRADPELMDGSDVIVEITQGGVARDITISSANSTTTGPGLTGTINTRQFMEYRWDGTQRAFVAQNTAWQSY